MGDGASAFAVISKADATFQIHGATANSFTVIYADYEYSVLLGDLAVEGLRFTRWIGV
jgi:hypothetical protein